MQLVIEALALLVVVFVLVTAGIGLYIPLARHYGWVAGVNARSSHRRVTVVGAGIVLAAVLLPWVVFFVICERLPLYWLGFAVAAAAFSGMGWLDDRQELSVRLRLSMQALILASWLLLVWRAGQLLPFEYLAAWWPPVLMMLLLGQWWFINLFNFMDGLDGFAAAEALFVMVAYLCLLWPAGGGPWVYWAGSAAVAGLLVWNWPPARVFMGDAGSLFLGFWLSAPLWLVDWHGINIWLILTAAFNVDASLTLLARWQRGEKVSQAHRSHLYQRLAGHWESHTAVLLALLGVNLGWLLPWAWVARQAPDWAAACTLAAYGGLTLGWCLLRRVQAA